MSATLRLRCTDIPSAGSRCKGTNLFWIEQEKCTSGCIFLFRGENDPNGIRQAPHNAASEPYRGPAANKQRCMDSVRKNANEVHKVN